jgi:hypothetical protein
LPPRSPELQPAVRLWPLVNERVANRPFSELDELEEALVERCLALSERPELLRGCTRYRWWPERREARKRYTRKADYSSTRARASGCWPPAGSLWASAGSRLRVPPLSCRHDG